MRGKRTTRGLIVALVATMTVGMLSGVALAAAQTDKQDLADELTALADTDHRRANWMMRTAAHLIERGLSDDLWEDQGTPVSRATFRADALAVRLLNIAGRRADGAAADLDEIKAELAGIDRVLASHRLDAAIASNGSERRIERATRLIARGDELADNGRYGRAIRAYMRAWQTATRGMGDGEPPVIPDTPNPAVTVEANFSHDGETWLAADDSGEGRAVAWVDYPVDFQFVVTNSGNVDLTNVALTDSVYGDDLPADCAVPMLAPGASYTCSMFGESLNGGDHVNTATVTATGAGITVTDSNSVYLDVRGGGGG